MAAINQAVDAGDVATTFNALCGEEAMITDLDEGSRDKYQVALREAKKEKKHVSVNYWYEVRTIFYGVCLGFL